MKLPKSLFSKILLVILFIAADLFIYVVLGLLFINYTDFYDESKGPWMSLESMTFGEKIIYFGIILWQIANLALIIWLIYLGYKKLKNRNQSIGI